VADRRRRLVKGDRWSAARWNTEPGRVIRGRLSGRSWSPLASHLDATFHLSPFTFHLSPPRPLASCKPHLALRQHRLQTPKHNRERLPIILNTRLRLLAPVEAIDEMFE